MQNILDSLRRLDQWVEQHDWKGFDTFDGLSSPLARYVTLQHPFLRQAWQQAVRRFPLNVRPILGIRPGMSSKGMGFFAQGYLRLYQADGNARDLEQLKFCLRWLLENRSPGRSGYAWGNHFEYQSRGGCIPRGTPTIVWSGHIGHAFLDAYDALGTEEYADVARSICDCILEDYRWIEREEGICLNYTPTARNLIHNSSMIGAGLLARTNRIDPQARYQDAADRAVAFTVHHQREDGAWYYGVGDKWKWVDSFHTGYVLEALDIYCRYRESARFQPALRKGYDFFINTFFGADGTPRYYDTKTRPLDIQCASQGIQTLVNLRELHPRSMDTALRVAQWTISHMQDRSGYFYYRKYPFITNKTPTLHWGQATMFAALALLYQRLKSRTVATAPSAVAPNQQPRPA
jgi:hypothetical protein